MRRHRNVLAPLGGFIVVWACSGTDPQPSTDTGPVPPDADAGDAGSDTDGIAWVRAFGSTGTEVAAAVASAEPGVFIAGSSGGRVDYGAGAEGFAGGTDLFIAHFSHDGAYRWAHQFGGTEDEMAIDLSVDADGSPTLVGSFAGEFTVGGSMLTSTGGSDLLVLTFDAAGEVRVAARYGGIQLLF